MKGFEEGQPALSFPTDTQYPSAVVPIFYLHEGEHPWCLNPHCLCHQGDAQVKELLLLVITRKAQMRQFRNGTLQ